MIEIGQLPNARAAQAFVDYLTGLGIESYIEPHPHGVAIMLVEPQHEAKARNEFAQFVQHPHDEKYLQASWDNGNTQTKFDYGSGTLGLVQQFITGAGPLTLVTFFICVLVYALMNLGMANTLFSALSFVGAVPSSNVSDVWRVFTPSLMHFSAMHIIFNLLWWWYLGGKIEIQSKVPLKTRDDLSRAYTPGVARICQAIVADPADARRLTIKRNTVAVVTDGSAVLGLGNIGPAAALPVMEGKAALFKRFADVDAWPVCLDTQDVDEIVRTVQLIAPVYGGINLEDISAPRCFEVERRLRELLDIPVFHDDQHGTAIVVLAALRNALKFVKKDLDSVKIVLSGVGAAGNAIARLFGFWAGSQRVCRHRVGS